MRQFLLPADSKLPTTNKDGSCTLTGKSAHYLLNVLRLKIGDSITGLATDERRYHCIVETNNKHSVTLVIKNTIFTKSDTPENLPSNEQENNPRISLAVGISKQASFDLIVRQATETGVSTIIPLISKYTVVREASGARLERWERIIQEARQQSGSLVATTIESPMQYENFLGRHSATDDSIGKFFFYEKATPAKKITDILGPSQKEFVLVVGAEGGFAPEEFSAAQAKGFTGLYLHGAILRAETAALYSIAVIKNSIIENRYES